MGRGSHRFLDQWHDRAVELPDGDVLRFVVIDEPAPPRIECCRTDRRGAIPHEVAHGLLVAVDHPDAALRVPSAGALGPGAVH